MPAEDGYACMQVSHAEAVRAQRWRAACAHRARVEPAANELLIHHADVVIGSEALVELVHAPLEEVERVLREDRAKRKDAALKKRRDAKKAA